MENNINNIPDELLAKYLLGEISGTEKSRVEDWLKQSGGNKKYYEQFRQIWNKSSKLSIAANVNEDEAWSRFKERTAQYEAPRSSSFNWLKIAAVLVLLAGAGGFIYTVSRHKEQTIADTKTTVQDAQIAPKLIDTPTQTKEIIEVAKLPLDKQEKQEKKRNKITIVGSPPIKGK